MAEGDRAAIAGLEFDPPWTTLGLGVIHGGTALNIIARECRLGWEFRPLPGVDAAAIRARAERFVADTLLPDLRRAAPEGSIVIQELCNAPALRPEAAGAAEALALRLTGSNRTATASFGSEAGQFQESGISTVMCGPGDIAQAHQPDEFIAVDQVRQCEGFLRRLADWAAS
jgi:acetylornithine deacetylase